MDTLFPGQAVTASFSYPFQQTITNQDELRALIGTPGEIAIRKEIPFLDDHCRTFIANAPIVLVGTAGASGRADVSPRGDGPGFALVLDAHTLLIPDRPGNRRVDSFQNILENPHVGLLFIIPGIEETLRVNGMAMLVRDGDLMERMTAQGRSPQLAIAVQVEEAFLQCAKALKRSKLWQQETWPGRGVLATMGKMMLDQTKICGASAEEINTQIEESYVTRLY
jgi:PPOX class probable FMN-dependent enzyme